MTENRPLTEEERTELVAFLDGELHGEAARDLEARLSRDPVVRAEADALKQAWDMLDYLPRPEPSPSFTHRTMERLEPLKTTATQPKGWVVLRLVPRALLAAGWAAAVVLAFLGGVFGYQFYAARQPPGDRELVRELRTD